MGTYCSSWQEWSNDRLENEMDIDLGAGEQNKVSEATNRFKWKVYHLFSFVLVFAWLILLQSAFAKWSNILLIFSSFL
jgi:hypothetical protein